MEYCLAFGGEFKYRLNEKVKTPPLLPQIDLSKIRADGKFRERVKKFGERADEFLSGPQRRNLVKKIAEHGFKLLSDAEKKELSDFYSNLPFFRDGNDYDKFIRPSELARWMRHANMELKTLSGVSYNPLNNKANLSQSTDVNYMAYGRMSFKSDF